MTAQNESMDRKGDERMETTEMHELYQLLERDFESTFAGALIPGILHNFANPLNGLMGRAQILQRRLQDTIAKIGEQYPEAAAAFAEPHRKLSSDVAAICQESDRFYYMFQDVSGRFYNIGSAASEGINLSRLIAAELRFADYYLDFKHEVRKEVNLDDSLPDVQGITSYYSLCFWSLFREAMTRMKREDEKVLYISTTHDNARVVVRVRYPGPPLNGDEKRAIDGMLSGTRENSVLPGHVRVPFYLGLCLLRRLGARIDLRASDGSQEIVITLLHGKAA